MKHRFQAFDPATIHLIETPHPMAPDEPISESPFAPPVTSIHDDFEGGDESLQNPNSGVASTRPGTKTSMWKGARDAVRIVTYIILPLAMLMIVPGLALSAFGLGSGRGFDITTLFLQGIGFYLIFAIGGGCLGAIAGMVGAWIPPAPEGSLRARLGRSPKRPLRDAPERLSLRRGIPLWLRILGSSLFGVVVVAFGVGFYVGKDVDRRLAEGVAEAERDDPNWRLEDLIANRIPVPDEENSAIVVGEVVAKLPKDWPFPASTGAGMTPAPTELSKVHDDLKSIPDNVLLDERSLGVLRTDLKKHEEAVRLARTIANYDRGRHELEWALNPLETQLPETQATRSAARLLAVDAAVRAQPGDLDGALDSCRAILGVARSIGDEPFFISQLVRKAIGSVGLKSARHTMGQGEPSDEALEWLQSDILDELADPFYLQATRGERAVLIAFLDRLGTGELPISVLGGGEKSVRSDISFASAGPWGRVMFENQIAVALEWMNEAVAIAKRPPAERILPWKAWNEEVLRVRKSWYGIYSAPLAILMTPAVEASGGAYQRYQAELGTTAILIAAERHRRKAGAWPASIDAIDRALLPDPPLDPHSGKPFLMEYEDGQLRIYSIGPNLIDEHGDYDTRRWKEEVVDDVGAIGWDVSLRRQPPQPASSELGEAQAQGNPIGKE